MKVAILTDSYGLLDGVSSFLKDFVPALREKGVEVIVAGPFEGCEVRVPSLPFPFYRGYRISLAPPEIEADVYHVHGLSPAWLLKTPSLLTFHTNVRQAARHLLPEFARPFGEFFLRTYLKFYSEVPGLLTTQSEAAKRELVEVGIPTEKIRVIPLGIRLEKFRRADPEKVRRRVRLPEAFVLYAGRLSKEKNLEELKELVKAGIPVVVVGAGPLEPRMREWGFIFLGRWPREELPDLYSAATLVINPSRGFDTQGLSLVEGMASGTPCAGPKGTAQAEVIGDAGLIYEEISEVVEFFQRVKARRKEFRRKALQRAKNYSVEKTVDEFLNLYEEIRQ